MARRSKRNVAIVGIGQTRYSSHREDVNQPEMIQEAVRLALQDAGISIAEVDVELIEAEDGWSPYLSLEDAHRLDDVREALRRGDLRSAKGMARIYTLTPIAV
jgi:acetyl-CoA acetyltransferase